MSEMMKRYCDLLPCHFCGGKAREYVEGGHIVCCCHKCAAGVRRALLPAAEWTNAVDACRTAWNSRMTANVK